MKKPTKAVDACEEFFLMVVEAHIQSAAMTLFGMSSGDTAPTNRLYFPVGSQKLAPSERKQVMLMAAGSLVDEYVDLSFDTSTKKADHKRDTHTHKEAEHSTSTPKEADRDGVVEYASEVLTLGLLLMEFDDAIREGE